jgi:hypothetical protein
MTTQELHSLPTTNGSSTHDGPVEPTTSFDPSIFRSYLLSLLPPVIGASPAEIKSMFDDEFDECVSRFAIEGSDVIYVIKAKDEVEGLYQIQIIAPEYP